MGLLGFVSVIRPQLRQGIFYSRGKLRPSNNNKLFSISVDYLLACRAKKKGILL